MMGKDDWHMHWEENWRADDVKIFYFFLEGICHMPPGEEDMKILGKIKSVLVENELHGERAGCDFQRNKEKPSRRILRRFWFWEEQRKGQRGSRGRDWLVKNPKKQKTRNEKKEHREGVKKEWEIGNWKKKYPSENCEKEIRKKKKKKTNQKLGRGGTYFRKMIRFLQEYTHGWYRKGNRVIGEGHASCDLIFIRGLEGCHLDGGIMLLEFEKTCGFWRIWDGRWHLLVSVFGDEKH